MLSPKTVRPLSCAACAILGALGLPGAALAASQSFTATGDHSWIVPPAVKTVQVAVVGGRGGAGSTGGTKQAAGGPGATARVTLAVTPGETLYARVAGDGEPANGPTQGAGGYGGGGDGGPVQALLSGAPGGGGGGGASSVLPCGGAGCIPLVVGGGGGGGGGRGLDATPSINGGDGGDGDRAGSAGEATVSPFEAGGAGGQPGTTSAGGAPGANSYENPATAGQAGLGGNGGTSIGGGGGGGGGGIFGGGGGAAGDGYADFNVNTFRSGGGGGGGGGASGVPASATGTSDFALLATAAGAEPSVTFNWSSPPPSATTNAASGIEPTKATLAGTVDANLSSLIDCHFTIAPASPVGDRIPCAQQVSESAGPVQVTALVGGLKPATLYTVRLVAGNASGSSEGEPVTFRTASGLSAAPQISRLRLSPARFRPGHSHAQRSRLASTTTIRFNLSRAAAIRFGVKRITHNHSAMRYATVPGSMRVSGRRGANRIRFAGVLGGRPLTPGRYRLAVDAATAGSASRPAYAAFTIVR